MLKRIFGDSLNTTILEFLLKQKYDISIEEIVKETNIPIKDVERIVFDLHCCEVLLDTRMIENTIMYKLNKEKMLSHINNINLCTITKSI